MPTESKRPDGEMEVTPEVGAQDGDAEGEEEMSDTGGGDVPMVSA